MIQGKHLLLENREGEAKPEGGKGWEREVGITRLLHELGRRRIHMNVLVSK